MTAPPLICFGQQPCGFFPRRFLFSKIATARRLQAAIGGEIVFFYHDSDHDPRETRTLLRHRATQEIAVLNFSFETKTQRKFSPLFLKRIAPGWQEKTAAQLPNYLDAAARTLFSSAVGGNPADFCLDVYRRMGLLDGIRVVRSSDAAVRRAACDVGEFFVDLPHEGEVVRARWENGAFRLHAGGDEYVTLPSAPFGKEQVSPARDSRLRWMQSVIHCTHYIAGAGEAAYLHPAETPEVTFINRDPIERSDEAYTEVAS
jgi:hypothetical protein